MIAREESRDERGLTISRSVALLAAARSPAAPAAAPTRATVLLFLHTFNEGVRRSAVEGWKRNCPCHCLTRVYNSNV